jgi:GT2 family glycosyltransferase
MAISVCLLNYNSYADTIECVDNLLNQTINDFSIVIVDNCSSNDSLTQISSYLSAKAVIFSSHKYENQILTNTKSINISTRVFLIANSTNTGFSSGNNIAINFSNQFLQNDQILLLNNDTVVDTDFLKILDKEYKVLQKKAKCPIALGVSEYSYYTKKNNHSGFHYLNLLTGFTFTRPVYPYFKYICGACLMIDNQAPLLNEDYFLYFDDIEYSKTLLNNDYKLYTTDKTHYFHKISSSMPDTIFKVENQFISTWKFFKKHYPYCISIVFLIRYLQYRLLKKPHIAKIVYRTYITR